MKKSTLVAGAMAFAFGILLNTSVAVAHGHGGGHHGGGHHGGGHGHYGGGYYHDNDGFWAGAVVGGLVAYGAANANGDPCNDPNYRVTYPGVCNN